MRTFILSFALVVASAVYSQEYNSVFPIVNTFTKGEPEFIAASVSMAYEYMGKKVFVADGIQLWQGNKDRGICNGRFLSFTYVTKSMAKSAGEWNAGSESTQMAFHPGGNFDVSWTSSMTSAGSPLYAFSLSSTDGLRIINLRDYSVVATLDNSTDAQSYASLMVFAGKNVTDKDLIVVAGKNTFKVFETIPETNGVKALLSSSSAPSYFDMNGRKLDSPRHGVNIVVDRQTTKKVVVK